ncbi:MAG: hypothetical protein QGI93_11990 [Planctomycetota bacterium]|nr:hypothetical protein [Planctomycetota bacterium]
MLETLRRSLLPTLGGMALALPSPAQVPLPDGLDGGPCSERTRLTLPYFPAFKQDSLQICWLDCGVETTQTLSARWKSPSSDGPLMMNSNDMGSELRLRDNQGALLWRGHMNLTYSRTWLEDHLGSGNTVQVWRFLVNGDLKPTKKAGDGPILVPSCAAECGRRVRYTGYIDWVKDLSTGVWENAWMLTHSMGRYEHDPGFPRGGLTDQIAHYRRVNCFVGPGAGFQPSPLVPHIQPSWPTVDEAVRRVQRPEIPVMATLAISQFEEPILPFQMPPLTTYCACDEISGQAGQFAGGPLSLTGSCGTSVTTDPLTGAYVSMGIGYWYDPSVYPGWEFLRWNIGFYDYFEPAVGKERAEVFHGVTTIRGFMATALNQGGPSVNLPLGFIDQSNALQWGETIKNVPFESDHILNLNIPPPPPPG